MTERPTAEERLSTVETLLSLNLREHDEIKADIAKILSGLTELNATIKSEMARRGVLVAIGGGVFTGFVALVWARFGPDAVAAVHNALHQQKGQ